MRARLVKIAIGICLASSVAAQPPSAPVEKASEPLAEQQQPKKLAVASADEVRTSSPADQQQESSEKPARHARVTSCRCGGQNPGN